MTSRFIDPHHNLGVFLNPFSPLITRVQTWLDRIEISSVPQAQWICRVIPSDCPFERDIRWRNRTLIHIPAFCQINPVYEQLIGLRFRAATFLVEVSAHQSEVSG